MATLTLNIPECPSCKGSWTDPDTKTRLEGVPLWFILETRPSRVVPTVFRCPHCGLGIEFQCAARPLIEEGSPDHQGLKQEVEAWERMQPADSLRKRKES